MKDSLELKIQDFGFTNGAFALVNRMKELKETDTNIDTIGFRSRSQSGYSGSPFLTAEIHVHKPFENETDFANYLSKHKFEYDTILNDEHSSKFVFVKSAYTTDAFCGEFLRPMRLNPKYEKMFLEENAQMHK